jgi:uncharacterized protein (TIGR01777 family)
MRIIIAGGSGFIGTALAKSLLADGNEVWILTRKPNIKQLSAGSQGIKWDGRTTSGWGELVSQVDAIVNLAGESIGAGLWTKARKQHIISSRVEAGQAISAAIQAASPRPKVLIQASAVGFYAPNTAEPVTEESAPGGGFMTEICKRWESSTQPVEGLGVRRVVIRTGIVLAANDGALPRLALPFKLFAGGPIGNGSQGLPWIHPADEVAAIRFLIDHENARGVFNLSAPHPLSNADFGRILASVLKRPYWLPVPAFAMRFLLGEMATVVLDGQFMIPKHLQSLGYSFRFETAEGALVDLYKRS